MMIKMMTMMTMMVVMMVMMTMVMMTMVMMIITIEQTTYVHLTSHPFLSGLAPPTKHLSFQAWSAAPRWNVHLRAALHCQ